MNKKTLKLLLSALSAVLLLGLLCFSVYHMASRISDDIETVAVTRGSYSKSIDADIYIFRDEIPLMRSRDGSVSYLVSNGEKVALGQALALVYDTPDSEKLLKDIELIKKSIEILKKSEYSESGSVVGADRTEENIRELMLLINSSLYEGDASTASEYSNELLIQLNKLLQMSSSDADIDAEIARLEGELARLEGQLGAAVESLTSSSSGYFYSYTDGYERIFTLDALDALTVDSFDALSSVESEDLGSKCIGKMAYTYDWYFALRTSVKLISSYSVGESYGVVLLGYSTDALEGQLEKILTKSGSDDAVLVFRVSRLPEDFNFRRSLKAGILGGEYSGLKVPTSAMRVLDGVSGVYVLYGNTVYFRSVEILGEAEGYYYLSEAFEGVTVHSDGTDGTGDVFYAPLREYDRVVVSGVGLYHGKVVG